MRVQGRYHANNPEAVVEAAIAGLGIGLLPEYLCADAIADGRLYRVLVDWVPHTKFGTEITALVPPERMRFARHNALVEFLRRELLEHHP